MTNQIAETVFEAFELEKLGLKTILAVSVLCLPVVSSITRFLSWTPAGLKRRDVLQELPSRRFNTRYFATGMVLIVASGGTLAWQLRDPKNSYRAENAQLETRADARVEVLAALNESGAADHT